MILVSGVFLRADQSAPPADAPAPTIAQTPEAIKVALKACNPDYAGDGKFKGRQGKVSSINLGGRMIENIAPLQGLTLDFLDLRNTRVGDLSPLKGMKLGRLVLRGCKKVKDFSVLQSLGLKSLDVSGTQFQNTDLAFLKGSSLESLNLSGTSVTDLSALEGLPLRDLSICGMKIVDYKPVAALKLRSLSVMGSNFGDNDLALFQGHSLEALSIGHTKVRNLGPLEGMPLKILSMAHTAIEDLSPLKSAPLVRLNMAGAKKVKDISVVTVKPLDLLNTTGTQFAGAMVSKKGVVVSDDDLMADQPKEETDEEPAGPAPTPVALPSATEQAPLETLSQQAPNAMEWVLAPLDQAIPEGIRQNITALRENLLDEAKAKPASAPEAYAAGRQLCDKLIAALDERDATLVRFGYRKAQANANTKVTSQALEARRNHLMSWPQYAREKDQAAEIFRQQMNQAKLSKELPKVDWSDRTSVLRKNLDALYAKYREALRQGKE